MRVKLISGRTINVDVRRKDVVRITMRVYPGGRVRITVPASISAADVRAFVKEHSDWLERSIDENENHDPEGTIRLQGRALSLLQRTATNVSVQRDGDLLLVSGPDEAARQKAFDLWWREQSIDVCGKYMAKWFPVMSRLGHAIPQISIRKMVSTWGSCTPKAARIRFNYYLLCAPPHEIEYVVLHELAHLRYPSHDAGFAAFMTEHMPDWRERRKRLNSWSRYIGSF